MLSTTAVLYGQGVGDKVALIRDGDIISMDAEAGTLEVSLEEAELAQRRAAWAPRRHDYQSGCLWRYSQTVGDAEKGAVTHPGGKAETHCYADI
jgi:dihydroxy-acid dehydratase